MALTTLEPMAENNGLPAVLSIAGLDPSGGAGLLADLRVFAWMGMYGLGVITASTSQNTKEVKEIQPLSPRLVRSQLDILLDDVSPQAMKTGMLATAAIVEAVARAFANGKPGPLVVDPVIRSTGGFDLGGREVAEAIKKHLLPAADMVTPNLDEAEALTGIRVRTAADAERAARALTELGAASACITGGHFSGAPDEIAIIDGRLEIFRGARQGGDEQFHGSGCFFSAALACLLARGKRPAEAVSGAKALVQEAMSGAIKAGSGNRIPWLRSQLEPGKSKH